MEDNGRTQIAHRINEDARVKNLRERGILFLDDDIGERSFSEFSRDLIYLSSDGRFVNGKPIWIMLSSRGGSIYDGLGFYDLIRCYVNKGLKINIVAVGKVASMATVIFQAAVKRYSLPNAQIMIHQASKFSFMDDEEVNKAEESVKELKRLNQISFRIMAERAGINFQELLDMTKKTDCWFDAEEARRLGTKGLIDEILDTPPF